MIMKDLNQVRMITANFSTIQGLKMVPIGLMLLVITLWANFQSGPAPRELYFPGGCIVVGSFFYWMVSRFYARTYGSVSPTRNQRRGEWIRGIICGAGGLAAFWLDVSLKPSFSLIGLVFAGSILAEYVRLTWKVKNPILRYYPVSILLLILLSVLPVLGLAWWETVGINSLMFGVCIVAGLVFIVLGVIAHLTLANWMPLGSEANSEQRI
jgi:hypothetical protein